jgi:hypothetical protein
MIQDFLWQFCSIHKKFAAGGKSVLEFVAPPILAVVLFCHHGIIILFVTK